MDSLQQQQRREEQILSLFESIEDRELRRADPGEPAAPDQFATPWEHADLRPPEPPPATPAQAPGYTWSPAPGVPAAASQALSAAQLPVKRKRGRPPKNAALVNGQPYPTLPPAPKPVEEEEDVCFICFDGGSLVLCDQKGCPKAYHPACIKRDESFFTARAKWMCGWHLCSTCGKGAYYMCYTCTYSLCKNCTKDADYVCVRGSKGLCGTCMKTIMLIEKIPQENQAMVQVDFDDKTSWEYLFKVYWVILKEKLSLTISELTQAKNPWIEPAFSIPTGDRKYDSGSSNGFQSQRVLRGRKPKGHLNVIDNEVQSEQAKANMNDEQPSSCQDAKWASKELLEFVAHMKNGDTSVLSQFDVQALLLEYIRKNNLRDTKRKCQIVCDSRLLNLFGRNVVGHFEMLKLLNSHFLVKENPKIDGFIRGSIVDPGSSQVHNNFNGDNQPQLDGSKRRKTRKKVDERMQQVDTVDYAAADAHNISLIYLQRNMLEKLLDDPEKFLDKVVGSVVRIRVDGSDQTQEIHRLVRVVGTSRAAEPYKVGNKTAGIMLEIMNLEKKELRPIDEISNQNFSEDECGQLRESIKCGQIKWLTVVELLQTALKLQEVRVNQGIETELLRLNHLRDRASENGHQKELRECVEKIQLLKSPEESQRRMQETPEVHTDRSLDPNQIYSDGLVRPRNGPGRKRKQAVAAQDSFANKRRNPPRGNQSAPSYSERNSSSLTQEASKRSHTDPAVLVVCALKNSACKSESTSGVASEVSPSPMSTATDQSVNDAEIYKMWHYQDPTGKTQGPFTMAQLRKWNASGHFPANLRIWRTDESREDAILLIEALNGNYNKQEPRISSNDRNINLNGSAHASPLQRDMNIAEGSPTPKEESLPTSSPNPNLEEHKIAEGLSSSEEQINTAAEVWKSLNDDAHLSPGQPLPQHCNSDQLAGNQGDTKLQGIEGQESCQEKGNLKLFGLPEAIPSANNGHNSSEKHSDGDGPSCQSSGQNWNNPAPVTTSDSLSKSHETSPQNKGSDVPDFVMPTVSPCSERPDDKATGDKLSMSSSLPAQHAAPSWSSAPSLATEATGSKGITNQWGEGYSFVSSKPVDEWDSTVGSGTSLTPTDLPGNSSALTSASAQQTTINPSQTHHPLPLDSSWQAIVNETNDFASLGEESVSDLLAEVEAMENAGLPSPTSAMKFVHDLNSDGKDDCFSPIEGFDPTPGPAKSEVFTSTIDLMVTTQPTVTTDVPHNAASNGDLADARRTLHKHSSSSSEPERSGKQQNVGSTGTGQWKSEHTSEPPRPSPQETPWQLPGASVHTWGAVQGSSHWQGTNHSHTNTELEARQGHYQKTGSFSSSGGPETGSQGILSNQQRYNNSGSSRYCSPQDRGYQGTTDHGYGRNSRGPWNSHNNSSSSRQYSSGGSGGGYRQQPSKGQRVCKFYESGYCKKGASCSYLHP